MPSFGAYKSQQLRTPLPFSWAAQMHTLTRKEEEQKPAVLPHLAAASVSPAPKALMALPPKPK